MSMPRPSSSSIHVLAGALLLLSVPALAPAQAPPRVQLGAGVGIDLLVAESDFLDGGDSRYLMADFRLDARDYFQVRLDGALTALDDDEDAQTGGVAGNGLLTVLVGPQASYPIGPFRPYAGLSAGVVASVWQWDPPGADDGDDDEDVGGTFAWAAHGGLGLTVYDGDHPVAFQAEARLMDAGTLPFARTPDPSTPRQVHIIREDIAVVGVRLGVTLGF